jgi:threonine/homoserine/homoserine lactone efflux protein
MPTTTTLLAFTAAAVALILLPGPNVIFLLARGIGDGRRVALISVAGVETATAVFVLATAAGLSAVIASSAVAFSLLRYGGAAYLIYLGIRALLGRGHLELVGPTAPRSPSGRRAFAEAFGVGIANPKVAIFFVAFFPQFLDPHRGSTTAQILVLGTIFTVLGLLFDTVWATSAGSVGGWLRRRPGWADRQRLVSGGVYLALGATAALTGTSSRS